jgi:hypothetical protein
VRGPIVGRVTPTDEFYLRSASASYPMVTGLEVDLAAAPSVADIRAALQAAMDTQPRFAAVARRRDWVVAWTGDDVPVRQIPEVEPVADIRRAQFDKWFDLSAEAPYRVGVRGRTLWLSWPHAHSDGPGGIGFSATVLRGLAGLPVLPGPLPDAAALRRRIWREAASAGVLTAFVHKALTGRPPARTFATQTPYRADSAASLDWYDAKSIDEVSAKAKASGGTLTGAFVKACVRACFELTSGDQPVRVMLPVNFRPKTQRWFPCANLTGNSDMAFTRVPTLAEATEAVAGALGPQRYVPHWASVARSIVPGSMRRRLDPTRGGEDLRLGRTMCFNNLGRLPDVMTPGVRRMFYYPANAVDYPTISLLSAAGNTAACLIVRLHQGGRRLADEILAIVRADLG